MEIILEVGCNRGEYVVTSALPRVLKAEDIRKKAGRGVIYDFKSDQ